MFCSCTVHRVIDWLDSVTCPYIGYTLCVPNYTLPHSSSAGTVVMYYAPSPPCIPAKLAQPAETSITGTAVAGPTAPGSL